MTDQIAPSLATELEQAAQECREDAKDNRMGANTCRELGGDPSTYDWPAEKEENLAALLTRAAALAKAAENMAEPIQIDWVREMYRCVVCGAQGTYAVTHADDCSWAAVKRLVSSEGKGE